MDPSAQTSGLLKWGATLAAGWIASRWKLDPVTVAGAITAVATLVWQIAHRAKVARAVSAVAAKPSLTDPNTIAAIAKAA